MKRDFNFSEVTEENKLFSKDKNCFILILSKDNLSFTDNRVCLTVYKNGEVVNDGKLIVDEKLSNVSEMNYSNRCTEDTLKAIIPWFFNDDSTVIDKYKNICIDALSKKIEILEVI